MLHGSDGVAMITRVGRVMGEKFGHRHNGIPILVMSVVS
jgi:hypothetical protein